MRRYPDDPVPVPEPPGAAHDREPAADRERDLERRLRSLGAAPGPAVPDGLVTRVLAARAAEGPRQRFLRAARLRRAAATARLFRLFGDPWLHLEHQLAGAVQLTADAVTGPLHLLRGHLTGAAAGLTRQIAEPLRAACRPLCTCLAPPAPR